MAVRCLGMLPEFLKEAERLCRKISGGGDDDIDTNEVEGVNQGGNAVGASKAGVIAHDLLEVLHTQKEKNPHSSKKMGGKKSTTNVKGLRAAISRHLDSKNKGGETAKIGIYDLVEAALK